MSSSPSSGEPRTWPGPLRAVVFDVGETLIDESTEYGTWADWLGVPRHTFSAVFGAVIAMGEDYREVFQRLQPGFELDHERQRRADAGVPETFGHEDLYGDARDCLERLRSRGLMLGVAGNQTARAEQLLRALQLPVDWIGTSSSWGVEKPSRAFFERLIKECAYPPHAVAYVGDRLDNDVRPALSVGLVTVLVRRGPWGHIQRSSDAQPHVEIEKLSQLEQRLEEFDRGRKVR